MQRNPAEIGNFTIASSMKRAQLKAQVAAAQDHITERRPFMSAIKFAVLQSCIDYANKSLASIWSKDDSRYAIYSNIKNTRVAFAGMAAFGMAMLYAEPSAGDRFQALSQYGEQRQGPIVEVLDDAPQQPSRILQIEDAYAAQPAAQHHPAASAPPMEAEQESVKYRFG